MRARGAGGSEAIETERRKDEGEGGADLENGPNSRDDGDKDGPYDALSHLMKISEVEFTHLMPSFFTIPCLTEENHSNGETNAKDRVSQLPQLADPRQVPSVACARPLQRCSEPGREGLS